MDIRLENVSYRYPGEERNSLTGINLEIKSGTVTSLLGRSGSGKSTLLTLLNGIRKPTEGRIYIGGDDINAESYNLKKLRERVGLVFQSPESQLFEESVILDAAFGPLNKGIGKEEAFSTAGKALLSISLGKEKWNQSPFNLSGGEKRKAALAGILSINGDVIVLDEISSGLDKKSRDDIFSLLLSLNKEGKTVIFTTHDAEEAAEYAERVILLEDGGVRIDGTIRDVYTYDESYMTEGAVLRSLLIRDGIDIKEDLSTRERALNVLSSLLRRELRRDG